MPVPDSSNSDTNDSEKCTLGLSGLPLSIAFKKGLFLGADERLINMSAGRNAAAALGKGGHIIAAASEERFNRIKGSEAFPRAAIQACLKSSNLSLSQVSVIAHAFDFEPYREIFERMEIGKQRYNEVFSRAAIVASGREFFPKFDWDEKFLSVPHHLAHAASAFCPSPFSDAIILVADGMGEMHSLSIYEVLNGQFRTIRQISAGHSLGILFGVLTHFLGFTMDRDEYKVMGLAAYGDPSRYLPELQSFISLCEDGQIRVPLLRANETEAEHEVHAGVLRELARVFGPARRPDDPLTRRESDIAAALHESLRASLFHVLEWARGQTTARNLCLAGGVALNSRVNGEIVRSGMFREIFVQPAASDEGTAIGAALVAANPGGWFTSPVPMGMPYFGPAESESELTEALDREKFAFELLDPDQLIVAAVRLLSAGAILGWHQGRMEFGPRALGNRSILADPRKREMRDRINRLIKDREDFRPLAPAVPAENAAEIFVIENGNERIYRHMTANAEVRPEWIGRLQAITHEDGSARVQVLFRDDNMRFWQLLRSYGEETGVPVLLNTSLNIRGEPITCSAADSLRTFRESGLDALFLGNYLVQRYAPSPE